MRSSLGSYHATVAEPAIKRFESMGYSCEPLGGGRIIRDNENLTIHIYGYSVGFGGADGGPPGAGMQDHSEVTPSLARGP